MSFKVGVIVFPGSNCVQETVDLFHYMKYEVVTIFHKESSLPELDLYVLPGGFSYGDYIRTGMLASKSLAMDEIEKYSKQGKKVLGICNGFQILCERKLLPGTFRINKNLTFYCGTVTIREEGIGAKSKLLLPIANGEGNYYHPNPESVNVAFKYVHGNQNGSVNKIAGIYNDGGNILGIMPHPERAFKNYHESKDGMKVINSFMEK